MTTPTPPPFPGTRRQEYEVLLIEWLEPHPDNPRTHDKAAIASSLQTNGFYGAAVVRQLGPERYQILAGHGRVDGARDKGLPAVPCVVVEANDVEAIRILLADNATSDRAGYDRDVLDRVLEELGSLEGTGFDVELDELARFIDEDERDPEPDPVDDGDDDDFEREYGLVLTFDDEAEQEAAYTHLRDLGYERIRVVNV